MYLKEEIWSSFVNEIRIIKHLTTKLPETGHHHRPTEKQRSTLELLQYISMMGIGIMESIYNGNSDAFMKHSENSHSVTVENFNQRMDDQEKEMKELFEKFDDETLNTELSMWGMTMKKSLFILNLLKMMTAYKMQLFLYIKAAGNTDIGTANLWAGIDMPQV